MPGGKLIQMTATDFLASLDFCMWCQEPLDFLARDVEMVVDMECVAVGYAHIGHCAHQAAIARVRRENIR